MSSKPILWYSLLLSFKHFLVDVIWYFSFFSHFLHIFPVSLQYLWAVLSLGPFGQKLYDREMPMHIYICICYINSFHQHIFFQGSTAFLFPLFCSEEIVEREQNCCHSICFPIPSSIVLMLSILSQTFQILHDDVDNQMV